MAYTDTLDNAEKFSGVWRPTPYFHLRPTSKNATIVCTIPRPKIAMRGKQNASLSFVKEHYCEFTAITPDMGDEAILDKLRELGFSEQTSAVKEDEKLIQAKFINLISKNTDALAHCGYSNVHFIASELVYSVSPKEEARKGIADVVAVCDECLLLVEVKKGVCRNSGDDEKQLENYRNFYFDKHKDKTIELLKHYPNHRITGDMPVKMIYLLKEDGDSIDTLRFNDDAGKFTVRR